MKRLLLCVVVLLSGTAVFADETNINMFVEAGQRPCKTCCATPCCPSLLDLMRCKAQVAECKVEALKAKLEERRCCRCQCVPCEPRCCARPTKIRAMAPNTPATQTKGCNCGPQNNKAADLPPVPPTAAPVVDPAA